MAVLGATSASPLNDDTAAARVATTYSQIFDEVSCNEPLDSFNAARLADALPELFSGDEQCLPPPPPSDFGDEAYLYPELSRNEYTRLTLLWYYTRGINENKQILRSLQTKVDLLRSIVGWEYAICGIIDAHAFQRLATSNIPLAVLPRRESTCSHTIQGTSSNSILAISDMSADWRFRKSPHVDKGGLRSYAGTPIVCINHNGEAASIGSLCVASELPGRILTPQHKAALVGFSEIVATELINNLQLRRREQQQRMSELLNKASSDTRTENAVLIDMVHTIYPNAEVLDCDVTNNRVIVNGSSYLSIPLAQFRDGLWEDTPAIQSYIDNHNYKPADTLRPFRAVAGFYGGHSFSRALVLVSNNLHHVFDDIDAWFLDRCATILGNRAHARSLREARHARDAFLRGLTHQLRTPIHGVLGSLELLAEELQNGHRITEPTSPDLGRNSLDFASVMAETYPDTGSVNAKDYITAIRNSGRELMSTVNNLISLSRWESIVAAEHARKLTSLITLEDDIMQEALKHVPDIEIDRICIIFDNQLPENTSCSMIDIDLLTHALSLLLANAHQYTQAGCVAVSINAGHDCNQLVVDIEDTGKGVAIANRQRIFEAFEKEDEHSRGAGLGLTIASLVAKALSGSVQLISSSEQGSHFRVTFVDPGLGCLIGRQPRSHELDRDRMAKYHLIPCEPRTLTIEHFERFLASRQYEATDFDACDFTVVSYSPGSAEFEKTLNNARTVKGPAVCLCPTDLDTGRLTEEHPHIDFVKGPFTTARLNSILRDMEKKCPPKSEPSATDELLKITGALSAADAFDVTSQDQNGAHPIRRPSAMSPPLAIPLQPSKIVPNVLLVDDNAVNLKIVKMYCTRRALPFRVAVDGFHAIAEFEAALAAGNPIQLILLDLQMPRCDGIQACEAIRRVEKEKGLERCVIFIVTGQDAPSDKTRAKQVGADQFYVKPLGLKALDQNIGVYFEVPVSTK